MVSVLSIAIAGWIVSSVEFVVIMSLINHLRLKHKISNINIHMLFKDNSTQTELINSSNKIKYIKNLQSNNTNTNTYTIKTNPMDTIV